MSTDNNILTAINNALAELGDDSQWIKAPEFKQEYESLKGKQVVLVDDVFMIITNFLAEITVATDGNFHPIHFKGESMEVLVEKILKKNPAIVLMDYTLSETIKGDVVTAKLREAGFTATIIGFSSESDNARRFEKAGANTSIGKMSGMTDEVVATIANFIKSQQ